MSLTLQEQVQAFEAEVEQLREALLLLDNPPKYGPRFGELPALDFLKEQVKAAKDDRERERLIELSKETLLDAEARLSGKRTQLQQLERDCQAIANEMRESAEAVLSAESAYKQALQKFEQLALQHTPRWQQLNPGQQLYEQLGRVEFPGFVMSGCCAVLTTEAIARDFRK